MREAGECRPRRVVILQETLPDYRVALFERIGELSSQHNIDVSVVHGFAPGERGARLSTGELEGAVTIRNRYLSIPKIEQAAVWQPALRRCLAADLVVVEQANRMLINYVLLALRQTRGPRVAFWGHGRNFQTSPDAAAEKIKAKFALLPDWWFAYTSGVASDLQDIGFDAQRITTIGNTIDVEALASMVNRYRLQHPSSATTNRCLFLGGLHPHKQVRVLFAAADTVASVNTDFELLIAGAGEDRPLVEQFVESRPWASYCGPVSGEAKAAVLASADLLLMPGLVGLVVLDSFASGVPLVTRSEALHSPEIEYLRDGENGIVVLGATPGDYARAVTDLLRDRDRLSRLKVAARQSASEHSLDAAAENFVEGLRRAVI